MALEVEDLVVPSGQARGRRTTLRGTVSPGVEAGCLLLTTDRGVFQLLGPALAQLRPGMTVEVDGAPDDQLETVPLSDGGPGFVDAMAAAVGGSGPSGRPVYPRAGGRATGNAGGALGDRKGRRFLAPGPVAVSALDGRRSRPCRLARSGRARRRPGSMPPAASLSSLSMVGGADRAGWCRHAGRGGAQHLPLGVGWVSQRAGWVSHQRYVNSPCSVRTSTSFPGWARSSTRPTTLASIAQARATARQSATWRSGTAASRRWPML